MRQFNNKSILKLQGFESFLERLQEAGVAMDIEGRKCFEKCSENLYDELYFKAVKAGLDNRLVEQMVHEEIENQNANIWRAEVGWKKQKPTATNPLPDTYKVMFYNYGTPKRKTTSGANRGKIEGTHFIKKAKLAARNRNKKLQEETLKKIIEGLKK